MRLTLTLAVLLIAGPAGAVGPPARSGRAGAEKAIREVAGSAEYLRGVPKRFGIIESVDVARGRVTLRFDGEAAEPDAEEGGGADRQGAGRSGDLRPAAEGAGGGAVAAAFVAVKG